MNDFTDQIDTNLIRKDMIYFTKYLNLESRNFDQDDGLSLFYQIERQFQKIFRDK